jgi:hypothetical protein
VDLQWLEGDRTFSIVFGTVLAAASLSVAIPTLYWCLPDSRRLIFGKRADPHQYLQLGFGLFGMAMAFANALCRYIPHRRLGVVHPTFFLATLLLLMLLSLPVMATAFKRNRGYISAPALSVCLAVLVFAPVSAVVQAFWPK